MMISVRGPCTAVKQRCECEGDGSFCNKGLKSSFPFSTMEFNMLMAQTHACGGVLSL